MKKFILIVSLALWVLPGFAQKINDGGGYYTSNISILENSHARYKDLKASYNKNDYYLLDNPRFGLGLPWINILIPGLAQYIMDEPRLGTTYLLIGLGCGIISGVGGTMARQGYLYPNAPGAESRVMVGGIISSVGGIGSLTVGVLSILNAYDVLKVKSLYIEDLRNARRTYSFSMQPTVDMAFTPNGYRPAPGMSLRVSF